MVLLDHRAQYFNDLEPSRPKIARFLATKAAGALNTRLAFADTACLRACFALYEFVFPICSYHCRTKGPVPGLFIILAASRSCAYDS